MKITANRSEWIEVASKSVPDSDGFLTDYTMYRNADSTHFLFMLGDKDIYEPDTDYADFETSNYDEAVEWWSEYGEEIYSSRSIQASEEFEDYEDDIEQISQEFTSENTSINSTKLPAIFKMVSFEPGTINIDVGGGRFDNVADYLVQYDVVNLVYDPYNRTDEHNKEVIRTVKAAGGADTGTCSNVLNVIKEPEARLGVLRNLRRLVKPGGKVYITVYEGKGDGAEGPTKSGYQLNRKTADYLDEIQSVFPDAKRKGKLITATNSGGVSASMNIRKKRSVQASKKVYTAKGRKKAVSASKKVYTARGSKCSSCDNIQASLTRIDNFEIQNTGYYYSEYSNGKMKIDRPRPYDDAPYYSANSTDGFNWNIVDSRGKVQSNILGDDEEEVLEAVAAELDRLNKKIEPQMIHNSRSITSAKSTKTLYDQIHKEVVKYMTSSEVGFSEDDVKEYSHIEIRPESDKTVVEVRCELGYDSMWNLKEKLDPIVAKYDKNAYFDMEDAGIITAYLFGVELEGEEVSSSIQAASEYEETEGYQSCAPVVLDGLIAVVDEYGEWEFDDEIPGAAYSFIDAEDGEYLYSDDGVRLEDATSASEHLHDVLDEHIPQETGRYQIFGTASLCYTIEGVYESYEPDEDSPLGTVSDVNLESAEVSFDSLDSSADVEVTPVGE